MEVGCRACNALESPGVCGHCGEPVAEPGPGKSVFLAHFLFWSSLLTLWAGELRLWVFPLLLLYGLYHAWHLGQREELPRYLLVEPRNEWAWFELKARLMIPRQQQEEDRRQEIRRRWEEGRRFLAQERHRAFVAALGAREPDEEKRWPSDDSSGWR